MLRWLFLISWIKILGKLRWKSVGDIWLKEGVEISESVSGNVDSVVSDETSIGLSTKFGSLWVSVCVTQYGIRSVVAGGFEGFSQICSDVGVEPK